MSNNTPEPDEPTGYTSAPSDADHMQDEVLQDD